MAFLVSEIPFPEIVIGAVIANLTFVVMKVPSTVVKGKMKSTQSTPFYPFPLSLSEGFTRRVS